MRKFLLSLVGVPLLCLQLLAQNRTKPRTVTDDKESPMPRAAVQVKSAQKGTETGADSTFFDVLTGYFHETIIFVQLTKRLGCLTIQTAV